MPNLIVKVPTATSPPLAGTESVYLVTAAGADARVAVDDILTGRIPSTGGVLVTGSTIPTNGLYLPAANTVGIATNGVLRVSVSTSLVTLASGMGLAMTNGKLDITDTGNETALLVASSAITTGAFRFTADSQQDTSAFQVAASGLTTGHVITGYSNSADTSARAIFNSVNDNTAATGTVNIRMQQDAAGAFGNFVATAAGTTTAPISTLTTSGAVTHHIQWQINGTKFWIAGSTTDPS